MFSPGGTSLNTDLNAALTASSSTTASAGDTVVTSNSPYTPTSIIHDPNIRILNYCMLKLQKIICYDTSLSSLCHLVAFGNPISTLSFNTELAMLVIEPTISNDIARTMLDCESATQYWSELEGEYGGKSTVKKIEHLRAIAKFEFSDDIKSGFKYVTELERNLIAATVATRRSISRFSLKQGTFSVSAYAAEFRFLSSGIRWNDTFLKSVFRESLNNDVILLMLSTDEPESFCGNRLFRKQHSSVGSYTASAHSNSSTSASNPSSSASHPDNMEIDQVKRGTLSAEERQRRLTERLCLYCGGAGNR
ncbi:hypothetical protein MP228_002331 [Amoeboaphelidium protococcarum]|nr:hypothetical protein MP228_002331 [Amoeboaphelidium protococcarum]